jgi:hypothetical protein
MHTHTHPYTQTVENTQVYGYYALNLLFYKNVEVTSYDKKYV